MKALFRNANVYAGGEMRKQNMLLDGASLSVFMGDVSHIDCPVFDNIAIFPGFCDVHVHFREPGFSYKETIKTGSLSAARGGYTAVMTMPNLNPTPDSVEHLKAQLDIIERDAVIPVFPYGTITVAEAGIELADIEGLAPYVLAYSDDGRGVQDEEMMLTAMQKVKSVGRMIAAHCEDNSLLNGGYIHDGEYAKAHSHRGICSESEWGPIKRDVELIKKSGVKYHVCHVSAKESVDAIREAKREGVDITAETGPHYLTLDDSDLIEDGRFKMNPPLRSKEDKMALIEGILDGTIDMIATDHAPHSSEEKSRGLEKSTMGVVGLESAFAVMYTDLVRPGIISIEELVRLMSERPRERFGITTDPGFTVFDLECEYKIDPSEFLSKGRATPFEGKSVFGRCLLTVYSGKVVYKDARLED